MQPIPKDKSRKGYILLEALLALGILVIAMISISELLSYTSKALNEDRQLSQTSSDMRNLALQLTRTNRIVEGVFSEQINGVNYQIEISRANSEVIEKYQIRITDPSGVELKTYAAPILFK